MADVIASTREHGFVKTLNGRMRCLPAIRGSTRAVLDQRLHAERQAVNTSVQGSAADVFKAALRDVSKALSGCFSTMDSRKSFWGVFYFLRDRGGNWAFSFSWEENRPVYERGACLFTALYRKMHSH